MMKRHLLRSLLIAAALTAGMSVQAKDDVTNQYLKNADLSSLTGWDNNSYTDWKTDGAVNVIEFWNYSEEFYFSQTVKLEAGDYRLAVNAFYRNSWDGDGTNTDMAWIFAGEKKQNVEALNSMSDLIGYAGSLDIYRAATAFSQGKYLNEFDFTVDANGTELTIGFKGTTPDGGWCILGPVKLYKYTLDDYMVDYREKVDEAKELLKQSMYVETREMLSEAIVEESTLTSRDEITKATKTLSDAIKQAEASVAAYEKLFAALEKGSQFVAVAIENGAPTSCETVLDGFYSAYEEGSIADDDIDTYIAQIDELLADVARQQTKVGSDMTRLLVNPDFEQSIKNEYGNTYGWTAEPFGNGNLSDGNVRTGGSTDNLCYEAWNSSGFDIYQVVDDAPFGVYEIEVQGFYRYLRGDNAWNAYQAQTVDYVKPAGVPVYVYMNNNATPFANVFAQPVEYGTLYTNSVNDDTYTDPNYQYWYPNQMNSSAEAFSADMYKQSAFGLVAFEGDVLRLGVKGVSNQGGDSWVIWDNFKLIYRGFDPEVIKPVLEASVEDVDTLYMGLLMGKSEYAALTTALADAAKAIQDNDGEAMFKALNDLYNAKDPARESKDIFLEQEVAADTLRLAEALREMEYDPMSEVTRQAANDLLTGICNNTIYENEEIDQLKQDVTDMISRLTNSVELYSSLFNYLNDLNDAIDEAEGKKVSEELLNEAKALVNEANNGFLDGSYTDEEVPDVLDDLYNMQERLLNAVYVVTGISTVGTKAEDEPVYTLGGQRVNTTQKGIYLKGNRKVVVK